MGCKGLPIRFPHRFPAGFWSKAYIITPEEAVKAVVVAKAMPMSRSVKAIPINIPRFLLIVTDLCKSNKNDSRE